MTKKAILVPSLLGKNKLKKKDANLFFCTQHGDKITKKWSKESK